MPTQPPKKKVRKKRVKKFRDNVEYLDNVLDDSSFGSVQGCAEQFIDGLKSGRFKTKNVLISFLSDDDLEFRAHGLTYDDLIIMAEKLKHYALGQSVNDGE